MVFSTCKKSGNDYVPSWCLYYFNSPLLPSNGTDCYLWLQVDGNYGTSFSSKVTWDHIRVTSPNVSWYKVIWKEHIPRNSVVSWLALLRMLPTKDRLRRCGMNVSDICVLCNNGIETHHHFFFWVVYYSAIWFYLCFLSGVQSCSSFSCNQQFISCGGRKMQEFSLQLSRFRKLFAYHSTDSSETACSTFSPYR